MLSRLNAKGRVWMLLIAWILFTGLAVADTFDLSDDIVFPTTVGQPAVAPDSTEERKPHALILKIFLYRGKSEPLSLIRESDGSAMLSIPFPRSDTPLYQRHSVYRI